MIKREKNIDLFYDEFITPENSNWINLYFDTDFDKLHPNTLGNSDVLAPKIANKLVKLK